MIKKVLYFTLALFIFMLTMIPAGCSSSDQYQLTTSVDPEGAGTVSPGGMYDKDSKIHIVATPNAGYRFEKWSGAASGSSESKTVTMDSDKSLVAHFVTGETDSANNNAGSTDTTDTAHYTVTVGVTPAGAGTVSPLGGIYEAGTSLTLTAIPETGYPYVWWSGDVSEKSDSITFTVNSNMTILAHFDAQPSEDSTGNFTLTTHINPAGTGLITPSKGSFSPGSTITLTAMPAEGYTFHHWSGGVTGNGASISVEINSNVSVVANFEEAGSLTLSFPGLLTGGQIPDIYTCKGADTSPLLNWQGVPYGTKSFALIMHDPDAPSGDFTHWVLYNIPADTRSMTEAVPQTSELENGMMQGINDFGNYGYDGPCPPANQKHQYYITLYALSTTIDLPPDAATRQAVLNEILPYVLEQITIVGYYTKSG